MTHNIPVGILGGGITGLSVAYGLRKKGIEAVVYEKDRTPGGVIQSVDTDGWLVEKGPNTLMVRSDTVWDLLSDLDLTGEIRKPGKGTKKRYIVKKGIPEPIPLSFSGFIKTNLFSASSKLRLFKEPFIPASAKEDESIATFVSRRLGREPLDYAVNPFVAGIYAGDPEKLSIKHAFSTLWELEQAHGSLAKGAVKNTGKKSGMERALISFDKGMETLPRALCSYLGNAVQCEADVQELTKTPFGWKIRFNTADGVEEREHQVIISTIPAHSLQELFDSGQNPSELAVISGIPYAPLGVVALGFRKEQIVRPLDGFGMLIPETESFRLLGTLFSSSLFPNRAPEGYALFTSFTGGARDPELAFKPAGELISIATEELNRLLHIKGAPVFSICFSLKQAIPQYEVGYDRYLNVMEKLETHNPGLFLAGNFRNGVSVPDCITNGIETAKRVVAFLST